MGKRRLCIFGRSYLGSKKIIVQKLVNKVKKLLGNKKQGGAYQREEEHSTKQQFPSDFTENEITAIKRVSKFSMTSVERLVTLYRAVDYIETNEIEGDVVECGVWRGGSMILVANRLKEYNNQKRNLFLFDTYEGMTKPMDVDVSFDNQKADSLLQSVDKKMYEGNNIWCYASIEDVRANVFATNYNPAKIYLIKGKVEDTLPTDKISKIALLRLDTDWYESTKHELEHLYDKLVNGGILIVDDYGHWQGAKKAVDEFILNRKLKLFLNRIDYTGRLIIKK